MQSGDIDLVQTRVLLSPRFDLAGPFIGDRAAVKIGKRFGYIDRSGEMTIETRFLAADQFSGPDGLAAVQDTDTMKWGYIRQSGEYAIQPQFSGAGTFTSDGLAWVKTDSGVGFINRAGQIVIEPQFEVAGNFSGGFAPAKKAGKWGYIDRTGAARTEFEFAGAQTVSSGLAGVRSEEGTFKYLRTNDWKVQPFEPFNGGTPFTGRLAVVMNQSGKFALASADGSMLTPFEFIELNLLSSQKASGMTEDEAIELVVREDAKGVVREKTSATYGTIRVPVKSTPQSATIFVLPYWKYDITPPLLRDSLLLEDYRRGSTNGVVSLESTRAYAVILVHKGRKQVRICKPAQQPELDEVRFDE